MSTQTYVFQRPSGYFFRFRIPSDIKHLVGKTELRYSLKTGKPTIAKSRARVIAGRLQGLIRSLRRDMSKLTKAQIDNVIARLIHDELEADEYEKILDDTPFNIDKHKEDIEVAKLNKKLHQTSLITRKTFYTESYFLKLLQQNGISDINTESHEYKLFCREVLKAHTHVSSIIQKRLKGDYSDTPIKIDTLPPTSIVDTGKTISKVIQVFFSEGDSTKKWTPKTKKEIEASLKLLLNYFGDIHVNIITRSMMSDFKQAVMKLPPNMNKGERYKDKTIHEIVEMNPEKTLAAHTINKILGRADTLLEYATVHGYIPMNPAKNMKVKLNKRNVEARSIFTPNDLRRLFLSESYREDSFRLSYQYWSPLLALFTGARVNEIAQLHLTDFQEHDDIWCININSDGDKSLKNNASKRLIPLHPFLIEDLGIIKRVKMLEENNETRFLHDLPKASGGYGVYVSRWFNERYKIACSISSDKVFHSFRHTFGTILSHNNINDHSLKSLMGHAEKGTTFDTYVKRGTAQKLYQDLVAHLDYSIDLGHLKGSKWSG